MSNQDARTPHVFLIRHGETDWAKSGQFTSHTEVDLNPAGVAQLSSVAKHLVGENRLIDPHGLIKIYSSPRRRAKRTLELLLQPSTDVRVEEKITYTEDLAEWNYGEYEGMKKEEIRALRKEKGLDKDQEWDVWSYGCEGGESVQEVTDRVDEFISRIKHDHKPYMHGTKPANILVVSHGLWIRCFIKRWIGIQLRDHLPLELKTGAVTIVSYKDGDINNRTLCPGLQLPAEK